MNDMAQQQKEYNIPISWESYRRVKVKANSLQEAIVLALKQFLSEPDEEYLCDSFNIDEVLEDEYPDESYDMNDVLEGL